MANKGINSSNNKRIAKNSLMLYFRMFVSMLVSLYTSRLILQALGETDFGIYNVVGGIVVMFSFISGSMNSSTSRYLTVSLAKDTLEQLKRVFSFSLTIHAIIAGIIFLLAETIGLWFFYEKMVIPSERVDIAFVLYQLSIITTMLSIMSVPYNASIISHERMGAFAYISISDVILKLLICYAVVYSPFDHLLVYGLLLFLTQVINQLIFIIYCHVNFEECKLSMCWDKSLSKEMISFAGWNMAGNLGFICYTQGLNLLINVFFGPSVNAARGIAVRIQGIVNQFSSNFQAAINPQITKSYAVGNLEYMRKLISVDTRYSFYLLYILSLPILIEAETILKWWLVEVPENTVVFLRIMLVTSYIEAASNPMIISSLATGDVRKMQLIVTPITLLILPISYIVLLLGTPPESVFLVNLIMLFVALIGRVIVMKIYIHFSLKDYLKSIVLRCVVVGVSSAIFPLIVNHYLENKIMNFFSVCLSSVVSVLVLGFTIGANREERLWMYDKMLSFIKKRKA